VLFNSIKFLFFFPIVVTLYFALPYRLRWMLLLAASCYFYMCWKAEYILLLFCSTSIDYWAALQMSHTAVPAHRKRYLLLSLFSNLGILFAFKYFNLFNETARALFNQFNLFYGVPAFELLLPVGISFYTFHALSYTIDVYHGIRQPEKHLGMFMLYVTFFPQLVAGPISRAHTMLPELYKKYDFDAQRVVSGLQLMAWGFFKKMVIADRLAVVVDTVYADPTQFSGPALVVATYFFAFQIYCDFSGYTDIAIGASRVMGYRLMTNFRQPYLSLSIGEFWQRWHISLSTWFRDYLYIPLGGNRTTRGRWYRNLLIVFVVSGLWHGANWTFVIWGALHWLYLVGSLWTKGLRTKLRQAIGLHQGPLFDKALKVFVTFHLVCFAWIFFRASSMTDALYIVSHLFVLPDSGQGFGIPIGSLYELEIAVSAILIMELVELFQNHGYSINQFIMQRGLWTRWAAYYGITFSILLFGKFGSTEFIYFQF
jgi:D-alanyl-lipoteichoic acid acyltransferase DltB (MBOAT superfamily)